MGARPSSFVGAVQSPKKATHIWSAQQEAVFRYFESGTGHLCIRARAGAAKTTTIIEGVNRAPEKEILVAAFNKKIADELQGRITNSCARARTLHSIGFEAIRTMWGGLPVNTDARQAQLTDAVCGDAPKPIKRLVTMLHTKGRDMHPIAPSVKDMINLALFFDYVPDEGWRGYNVEYVAESACEAMALAVREEPNYKTGVDYADMIYLPLAWGLLHPQFDLSVIDEAQDMTLAQLTIIQRISHGRIAVVGDDRQAIYGFRGADGKSLDRLKRELGAGELPLTTTYRCGQRIVEWAQKLVPDIAAHDSNPDGTVDTCTPAQLLDLASSGDFILSRLNAPLVSVTLQLLSRGKRARMAGRDLGKGITAVLKRLRVVNSTPVVDTLQRLDDWERKTTTRYASYGQVDLADRARDQAGMIRAFAEEAETTGDLLRKMEYLFSDEQEAGTIICSSVHKAKGLEAVHVFVLSDTFYRRGRTLEEDNLSYVAWTRAKSHLTIVEQPLL